MRNNGEMCKIKTEYSEKIFIRVCQLADIWTMTRNLQVKSGGSGKGGMEEYFKQIKLLGRGMLQFSAFEEQSKASVTRAYCW